MRVGVELMMTNISAAKSSLRPSKITHGTWMFLPSAGRSLQVEVQRREAVLAVDDQELGRGVLQVADVLAPGRAGLELQLLAVNSSTVPGIGGWPDGHLVEVLERPHLGARELALEGLVGALDAGDELGDLVVLRDGLRGDLLALAVEAADEADPGRARPSPG